MVLRLIQRAICFWVLFAVSMSGLDFCFYLSRFFIDAAWFINWAGGITSSLIGVIAGMAAWRGFGLSER